ncbi:Peptidase A1 [Macleaya cordata]|uniref:Peptidase A1 n=1 Tax=Macleaya cordata TaxID=56857 RepID=A0A200QNV6_MACCD|nr:Peptidase A1 [Macleaya cordata]
MGFTAPLIHRIYSPRSPFYNPNLTHSEQIQASIDQSYSRYLHYLIKSKFASSTSFNTDNYPDWIVAPLSPLHDHYGSEYMLSYQIGTPPTEAFAIIDTGSCLTWLQCLPCDSCFKQKLPIFDPTQSSTYAKLKCDNPYIKNCSSSTRPQISQCKPNENSCFYSAHYLDESYTEGDLATETLIFESDVRPGSTIALPNMAFGCGHNNVFKNTHMVGMIGLNRGELSFISQLGNSKFSYCLLPIGKNPQSETSKMHFGYAALIDGGKTPMITNPKIPGGYYVNLESISVGNERLSFPTGTFNITPEGYGGFVIDSGSTLTFLNTEAFSILAEVIKVKTSLTAEEQHPSVFHLCYWCTWNDLKTNTPNVTFHFTGVDLELSKENTWIEVKRGLLWKSMWCLAMHRSDDLSILGNRQQRNINVGYDFENKVISFKPMDCTKT